MVNYKPIICVLLFTISTVLATAQNNTNSPYTRYGYGELSDQSFANSKGMGGVAYGIRDKYHINPVNPASYTAIDSLTFLFDGGISLHNTNFSDGVTKLNAKNSSLDYVAMQFRLHPRLAMSLGLLPFSNVGYNISSFQEMSEPTASNSITYSGEGGLHQVYVGVGFKILKQFSIGANFSYFWGDITRNRSVVLAGSNSTNYYESNYLEVNDFKVDFGAQYTHEIDKKNEVTLGVVFTPKRSLNNTAYNIKTASTVTKTDTVATFETPNMFGVGLSYLHDKRWVVAVDYSLQQWSKAAYMDNKDAFSNRSKLAVGLEYLPSNYPRNFFSAIKYRAGAYYSTPYYKIVDENGRAYRAAKEYGLTAGLTLPVPRSYSKVSLAAQYVKVSGQKENMLDEKYFRVSIGISFNERWFFKRKVE